MTIASAPRALAVIPARGGSKRLPGKNVRVLGGRTALGRAIDAAVESDVFARIVVSTDDPAIAALAERLGADVPFLRDAALADDLTPVSAATVDALERVDPDGSRYDHVAQLMPNCPLRSASDIRDSHARIAASGAPAQLSVARFGWQNPWWAMALSPDDVLRPLFPDRATQRGQDLPPLFAVTGAVWWAAASVLRRERTFHVAGRTGWEMPWERAIDIDTEDDWRLAELLVERSAAGETLVGRGGDGY